MRKGSRKTKIEFKWAVLQADTDSDTLSAWATFFVSIYIQKFITTTHKFLKGEIISSYLDFRLITSDSSSGLTYQMLVYVNSVCSVLFTEVLTQSKNYRYVKLVVYTFRLVNGPS